MILLAVGAALYLTGTLDFLLNDKLNIKITRLRTLGTDDDIHHLHVSEIEVYKKSDKTKKFKLACADPCVNAMGAHEGSEPANAFDGDLTSGYHNRFAGQYDEPKPFYGTEDHFLHVEVKGGGKKSDVDRIVIHHGHPQKRRIVGAKIELLQNGKVVWESTFSDEREMYEFSIT